MPQTPVTPSAWSIQRGYVRCGIGLSESSARYCVEGIISRRLWASFVTPYIQLVLPFNNAD
jgi:hypothetical protein